MSFIRTVRIGVDVGDSRVGIASSDPDGVLATPVGTFERDSAAVELQKLIAQTGSELLYVGMPKSLSGAEGKASQKVREFLNELFELTPLPKEPEYDVYFIDERFTTVSAHQALSAAGKKTKHHRKVVDQVAAVMILQTALDQEKLRSAAAGSPWVP